jgi:hypothetical protein
MTVSVDVPEPPMEAGLKLAVAPGERPLALSVTFPVKPFWALTETVYVALFPAMTLCEIGVAAIVKSGVPAADSVRLAWKSCRRFPLYVVISG